jgi:hypothetical protein
MAQIRKRAPLQYQAQVRLQGHPEASRTFTSKADAVAWATSVEQITKQGLVSLMRCLSDWGQSTHQSPQYADVLNMQIFSRCISSLRYPHQSHAWNRSVQATIIF